MADLGCEEVTVIGGEAYLRDDWTDIVRAIRARGMRASMSDVQAIVDQAKVDGA
jgi:uncharacterized radical SAM superfamily Fe-S cluster-containing enzyme